MTTQKNENVPEEENKTYSPETPYAKMKQTKLGRGCRYGGSGPRWVRTP